MPKMTKSTFVLEKFSWKLKFLTYNSIHILEFVETFCIILSIKTSWLRLDKLLMPGFQQFIQLLLTDPLQLH